MTKKAGKIVVLVMLALALVFWIIAMATPGWFVFEIMVDISQIEVSECMDIIYVHVMGNNCVIDMVIQK